MAPAQSKYATPEWPPLPRIEISWRRMPFLATTSLSPPAPSQLSAMRNPLAESAKNFSSLSPPKILEISSSEVKINRTCFVKPLSFKAFMASSTTAIPPLQSATSRPFHNIAAYLNHGLFKYTLIVNGIHMRHKNIALLCTLKIFLKPFSIAAKPILKAMTSSLVMTRKNIPDLITLNLPVNEFC